MLGMYDFEHDIYHDTDVVYRAVHPPASNIEWGISEAPCVQCPVHLFCSETGPVNPAGCVYYDNWLGMDYV
jgi:DNA-directed RNA polymerase III subunit RPC6